MGSGHWNWDADPLLEHCLSALLRRVSVLSTYCMLGATPGPETHSEQHSPGLGLMEV